MTKDEAANKVPAVKSKDDEFRRLLEEKSKKYSHLPVYNKDEEKRKAEKRQATMASLFSAVDSQLGQFPDLTTAHMAHHGVIINPAPTPFDEEKEETSENNNDVAKRDKDEVKDEETHDVHTIKFRRGVLEPRHSESQSQDKLETLKTVKTEEKPAEVKQPLSDHSAPSKSVRISESKPTSDSEYSTPGKCILISECKSTNESVMEQSKSVGISQCLTTSDSRLEPSKSVRISEPPPTSDNGLEPNKYMRKSECEPTSKSEEGRRKDGKEYSHLGETLTLLTLKMAGMTEDLRQETEIPYIDAAGDGGDYTQIERTGQPTQGLDSDLGSSSSSETDTDTDCALAAALHHHLDPALRVARIQLEDPDAN